MRSLIGRNTLTTCPTHMRNVYTLAVAANNDVPRDCLPTAETLMPILRYKGRTNPDESMRRASNSVLPSGRVTDSREMLNDSGKSKTANIQAAILGFPVTHMLLTIAASTIRFTSHKMTLPFPQPCESILNVERLPVVRYFPFAKSCIVYNVRCPGITSRVY